MKRMLNFGKWLAAAAALFVVVPATFAADIVYSNTALVNDLVYYYPVTNTSYKIGDEIVLDQGNLASRILTYFRFEYWATNATTGSSSLAGGSDVKVQLFFYKNDGDTNGVGYKKPLTEIWSSTAFTINPTLRSTISYDSTDFGYINLPGSNMTWAVKFSGLGLGDSVGLTVYNPPAVGTNFSDFWQETDTGWVLLTNSMGAMNFGAVVEAVPEPSALAMLALGLGGLLAWRRTRKS